MEKIKNWFKRYNYVEWSCILLFSLCVIGHLSLGNYSAALAWVITTYYLWWLIDTSNECARLKSRVGWLTLLNDMYKNTLEEADEVIQKLKLKFNNPNNSNTNTTDNTNKETENEQQSNHPGKPEEN